MITDKSDESSDSLNNGCSSDESDASSENNSVSSNSSKNGLVKGVSCPTSRDVSAA